MGPARVTDGNRDSAPARYLALAAAFLSLAGAAQADHAPCLTVKPNVAAYLAAFEEQGWIKADADRRFAGLKTLAEAQAVVSTQPTVRTDAELAAFSANARASYVPLYDRTEILVKGGGALSIRIVASGGERTLSCVIAGPHLDEVDQIFRKTPPGMYGEILYLGAYSDPPAGALEVRTDITRTNFSVVGRSDFTGNDAIFVTLKLAPN